ncbi:MAG: glycosyltransferase family 4 protein [Caldilineaceae bacterium]|nr:glycosyltransferase family 4 protein [Caldilineaceae bacterium]
MTVIAIDYTPAIRQQAGIGRIIRGQIDTLVRRGLDDDIRLFIAGPVAAAARAAAPLPLHATPLSERNMVRIWHRLNLGRPRVERFTGGPLDLFHATDFVMAPNAARRKLLTVHDLAFLFYPDAAMPSLHRYLNVVVPRSVAQADHIIADSENTARDLQERWAVPPDRITVVQGAVDHSRFAPVTDSARRADVRARYGIGDRPFILALATLEPRKNFARLIRAFAQARADARLPHRLVIGGKKGWLFDSIFATVRELGLEEDVLFPGFVADEDLPVLYSDCAFFAYPSLYEGFGLPIIEAMACGAAVLTADNSCLPEAGGDAVFYVDAEDEASIAAGLVRLAEDDTLRAKLRRAGLDRARLFTWERSVDQLLAAYAVALEQSA